VTGHSSRGRAFVDLHCHTRASFDSLSSPAGVVKAAASQGLTHLAITDHDRIDGALEARDRALEMRERAHAPIALTIIVGEEIRTRDGDLIGAFLERAVPPGLSTAEAIAAVREQGGLVGIPHPFDRNRRSVLRRPDAEAFVPLVDWIETHNARVLFNDGNERARQFAVEHGVPGVAASDAHSVLEVGVAYVALEGDPSTPAGLLAALGSAELVAGRASFFVRLITPIAKLVQRSRGNRRVAVEPAAGGDEPRAGQGGT
jgi:predicted metal-dependent phosphoesterase TrpH